MRTVHDVLTRVRAEYLEMPGLRLTVHQVERLCGIERALCQTVLDSLVESRFLTVRPDGTYTRLSEGDVARPQAAKAELKPPSRTVSTPKSA